MKALVTIWLLGMATLSPGFGQVGSDSVSDSNYTRGKLYFSLGVGGAYVNSASTFKELNARDNTTGGGAALSWSAKLGYAFNTHWVTYCELNNSYVFDDELDYLFHPPPNRIRYTLNGIGIAYFTNKTSPSPYINASAGMVGLRGSGDDGETGWGFSFGAGYQVSNRWSLEANLTYGEINRYYRVVDFWSPQITFHYLWFKSYREQNWAKHGW